MSVIALPVFDPVAISIFGLNVHWYGLMWVAGIGQFFIVTRSLGQGLIGSAPVARVVDNLLFAVTLGGIVGGRLGYVLFYGLEKLAEDPLWAFRIWEGGMSFHGGFLGVFVGVYAASRIERDVGFLRLGDLAALGTPIGLGFGRLGNFVNVELWGRPSDLPWAVTHPVTGDVSLHPSQIYEMLGEGVLLFAILLAISRIRPVRPGLLSAVFLIGYSVIRYTLEFFREPDAHIGYLALDLTAGQWLSVPMFFAGFGLLWFSLVRK